MHAALEANDARRPIGGGPVASAPRDHQWKWATCEIGSWLGVGCGVGCRWQGEL